VQPVATNELGVSVALGNDGMSLELEVNSCLDAVTFDRPDSSLGAVSWHNRVRAASVADMLEFDEHQSMKCGSCAMAAYFHVFWRSSSTWLRQRQAEFGPVLLACFLQTSRHKPKPISYQNQARGQTESVSYRTVCQ